MTKFITNEDYTESSQKFPRHVKHSHRMAQFDFFPFTTRSTYMVNVGRFFFLLFFLSPSILKPPRGSKRKRTKSKTCCTNGPGPNFCFHATSWHKAKFPDTPLYRSSTDFPFSLYPASWRRAESPRHTAQSVSDRFFFLTPPRGTFCFSLFFFTPPRGTQQKSPTHCSNGPRPTFVFFFLFLHHLLAHFPFFLHHLVAQSISFRRIAKTVHNNYEAR